jgi:hypothetical protein
VTATQVNSASADSPPSAVIVPDTTPGKDTTPPKAKLALARTNLAKVVKRGFIPVNVTCDEDCAITVRAEVTKRLARRLGGRRKIAGGKGNGKAGVRARIRVKLTRRARRGLRKQHVLRFRLVGTFADAAHNAGTARRKAKLRRRR